MVLAVGRPGEGGLGASVGVVSALGGSWRTWRGGQIDQLIRPDLTFYPGFSGGPLVDAQGRVVGINTAIASLGSSGTGTESGNIGVGFAIPIDSAKTIADQLINGQTPSHAVLGVSVSDATTGGAQIGDVNANSGAAKAGLQTGDVVSEVDGRTIADADALVGAVRTHKPGDTISVTYTRNGERRTAQVTLDSSS
jgi:putative serine protease PepD